MKGILKNTLKGLGLLILLLALIVFARLGWAWVQVGQMETPELAGEFEFGSTETLTILPLYEEAAVDDSYQYGHGVAYLLLTDDATLLLDLGHNPSQTDPAPLVVNMDRAGVGMDEIDLIVISHNHPDHIGGLGAAGFLTAEGKALWGETAVLAPQPFTLAGTEAQVADAPQVIAPGVATLGRMPFVQAFPFWLWQPLGLEQVLAVNVSGKGIVLITGCGHPTLAGIVARAETLFAEPVVGVVGGLHYEGLSSDELAPHIQFLTTRQPELVALSPHDSDEAGLASFQQAFPSAYRAILVGQPIHFGTATALK